MKKKKINLKIGKKKIELDLYVVPKYLHWLGLMFKRRENAKALLFEFSRPCRLSLYSFFVRFEFIAIWLDYLGDIIEVKKVFPWNFSILPSRKFVKLIEIPCNRKYKDICDILVEGKRFKY